MPADQDPLNAKVVERQLLHDTLGIFRIAYEGEGPKKDFEPGQFANLALMPPPEAVEAQAKAEAEGDAPKRRRPGRVKLVRRAYSIASPPSEKRWLEFYIVAVDEGALTPRLFDLDVGDRLFMDTKIKGHFTIKDVPDGKNLVTVATGTGLAPFLSMYKQYKDTPGRFNRFVFIHGVRVEEDLGYRDYFQQLAKDDPRIVYLPAVSRAPEDSGYAGYRGRVTTMFSDGTYEQATGAKLNPETDHVFLCGNPAMIDQLEAELVERDGFTVKSPRQKDGNLHFERYW
ncbi:MAG: ferredoxin--NADP reductase [Phycisphaeraceae bacterium]|nr:ferredoxin--NADP reductase [Phycisphaeraceae bacterium]